MFARVVSRFGEFVCAGFTATAGACTADACSACAGAFDLRANHHGQNIPHANATKITGSSVLFGTDNNLLALQNHGLKA